MSYISLDYIKATWNGHQSDEEDERKNVWPSMISSFSYLFVFVSYLSDMKLQEQQVPVNSVSISISSSSFYFYKFIIFYSISKWGEITFRFLENKSLQKPLKHNIICTCHLLPSTVWFNSNRKEDYQAIYWWYSSPHNIFDCRIECPVTGNFENTDKQTNK